MDKYVVKLYARAYRDLEDIYTYIAENLSEPGTALSMIDELETAIFSLEQLPERGAIRRVGSYANRNYRQLFVKNYVIIYRVLKPKKEVHIVTVRYTPSNF
ncbi:MAG: type II toxin-antitoxin system RelE/ParE family toxin [Eubacteriales bacterium]|nr:type II toxin-antitoxin system RelE/ParE family toxin [Eubacteriales bacterium]